MAEHTSRLHAQVFDMFHQISLPAGDTEGCPPGILPPGWRSAYQARQRTAQVVLTLAKAAPKVCDLDPFSTGLRLCLDSWSPSLARFRPTFAQVVLAPGCALKCCQGQPVSAPDAEAGAEAEAEAVTKGVAPHVGKVALGT